MRHSSALSWRQADARAGLLQVKRTNGRRKLAAKANKRLVRASRRRCSPCLPPWAGLTALGGVQSTKAPEARDPAAAAGVPVHVRRKVQRKAQFLDRVRSSSAGRAVLATKAGKKNLKRRAVPASLQDLSALRAALEESGAGQPGKTSAAQGSCQGRGGGKKRMQACPLDRARLPALLAALSSWSLPTTACRAPSAFLETARRLSRPHQAAPAGRRAGDRAAAAGPAAPVLPAGPPRGAPSTPGGIAAGSARPARASAAAAGQACTGSEARQGQGRGRPVGCHSGHAAQLGLPRGWSWLRALSPCLGLLTASRRPGCCVIQTSAPWRHSCTWCVLAGRPGGTAPLRSPEQPRLRVLRSRNECRLLVQDIPDTASSLVHTEATTA